MNNSILLASLRVSGQSEMPSGKGGIEDSCCQSVWDLANFLNWIPIGTRSMYHNETWFKKVIPDLELLWFNVVE